MDNSIDTLTFDQEWHCYKLNGIGMSGVSSILKAAGLVDLSGIPELVLERARDFGIAVHKACELEDKGTLDLETLDPALMPYLEAWRRFKADMKVIIIDIEKPVYSKKWWYAGTCDRIATIGGKRVMVDIKSSATMYPSMKIQLAGYAIADEEMTGEKIQERLGVQLLKTADYKIYPYRDETSDRSVFLSAVTISKFKKKEKQYYGDRSNAAGN
jgi:hypothetical protein